MFDIWYVPEYPVGAINYSKIVFRPDWDHYRPGLLENMKEQGMVNPLILLNHNREGMQDKWLKVGNNRMWAILQLGWKHVPVVITGAEPPYPCEKVEIEDLPKYFRDGFPVVTEQGLKMAGYCAPEDLRYPIAPTTGDYNGKVRTHTKVHDVERTAQRDASNKDRI